VTRLLRPAVVALAVVLVAAVALAAAAWSTTPPANHLQAHVAARGRPVALSRVAPILVRALVATEDERFYRHHGIDVVGLLRAVPYDLSHLSFAQGASTLTEQVAKTLYLGGNDHTPWRKLQDMALAVKLEARYSKAQILAAYLDTTYFGAGAYGIAAASERYFGEPPGRLTLAQASVLAGLPQAPSADDPLTFPAAARARQFDVLRSLVRVGAISSARAEAVLARPLPLRGGSTLPPLRVAVRVGSAVSPAAALVGGLVFLAGVLALLVRLPFRRLRLVSPALGTLAALLFLLGAGLVARAFRTL
jgi:membrane peptidoglycan carboxypeptidase